MTGLVLLMLRKAVVVVVLIPADLTNSEVNSRGAIRLIGGFVLGIRRFRQENPVRVAGLADQLLVSQQQRHTLTTESATPDDTDTDRKPRPWLPPHAVENELMKFGWRPSPEFAGIDAQLDGEG